MEFSSDGPEPAQPVTREGIDMKRMMMAAFAVAGLAAMAKADFGGPQTAPTGYPAPAASEGCSTCDKYGTLPILRKLFWWKADGGHSHKGSGTIAPQAPPQAPGTLVFPYHQFNRGPRDFFMWEPGR